ncbi:hypothetical protein [Herbaspirillum sp. BH-1]|uniref:hypothetical protein n=1 Tax=Herbaspirillum sp. (strain BH-1) TaxID=2058884 RepID=UPI0011AF2715|nr:hypothetical protein [Herbaspirillum sp. BH-1]
MQLKNGNSNFTENYLPYDFDDLNAVQWRSFGRLMVKDELRELINSLNQWHVALRKWEAWNTVISLHASEMDAWDIRMEFLEGTAHRCLYQPSSMRDMFTLLATNSMHQVYLASDPQHEDRLPSDPRDLKSPHYPSRRQKEKFLKRQIKTAPNSTEFLDALFELDDDEYRKETSDYRNRTSHAIGPRLAIGITSTVTRSLVQAKQLQAQPNGTAISIPIPEKMVVQYGVGGTAPLAMADALNSNRGQYERAMHCYTQYRKMLSLGVAKIPKAAEP